MKSTRPSNNSECFLILNVDPSKSASSYYWLFRVSGLVAYVDPPGNVPSGPGGKQGKKDDMIFKAK